MSQKRCCIKGCVSKTLLHCFPEPSIKSLQFKQWVAAIGGELKELNHSYIYNNRKVCQLHFEKKHHINSRLSKTAVPSLHLKDLTTKDGDLDEDREHSPDNIEDDDSQSSPNGANVPKPVAIKIIETIIKLKITDKSIKTFCNDLREYSSHQLEERARMIDRFYSWLTDSQIRHCERIMGAYILKEHQEILPEVANHPFLLRRVLTPKKSAPSEGIFDDILFAQHIKPLIVELYKSREMKVRLHLLDSLQNYIYLFTEEEVKIILLPEILIGMQDSDKMIVRATLISLAQLVDVLGPTAVIGGQRQDIFTQTEVAKRETVEKMTELNRPQRMKEENDSANESEEEQGPFVIQERKKSTARKKDTLRGVIGGQKQSTSRKKCLYKAHCFQEKKPILHRSGNENKPEQDPLNIQERNKKRKVDVVKILTKTELTDPQTHLKQENDSANESEVEQGPLVIKERKKRTKRKKDTLRPKAVIGGQRESTSRKNLYKTDCVGVNRNCEKMDKVDSANESEAEQDPLDIKERSTKIKTNVLELTAVVGKQRQGNEQNS